MKEKINDILKTDELHLTEDELFGYSGHTLSKPETRRVEEHLAACDFCSDALDGIMQINRPERTRAALSSLKKSIRKRVSGREVRTMFPFTRSLAIAATVLLLAISAWYLQSILKTDTQKIFTDQFEPYPAPPAITEQQHMAPAVSEADHTPEIKEVTPAKSENKKSATAIQSMEPSAMPVEEPVSPDEDAPMITAAESAPEQEFADVKKKADAAVTPDAGALNTYAKKEQAAMESKSAATAGAAENRSAPMQQDALTAKESDHLAQGMALYQAADYSGALREFSVVLQSNPTHQAANFYSGICALSLNRLDEALIYLKKTDGKGSHFYEASLWYESLAQVKKGNKKEAEQLLRKVIDLNGEYKVKAEELIGQL